MIEGSWAVVGSTALLVLHRLFSLQGVCYDVPFGALAVFVCFLGCLGS